MVTPWKNSVDVAIKWAYKPVHAEIFDMQPDDEILSTGRKKKEVAATSLLCFRAVRELGLSIAELARYLEMSAPGIG